MIRTRALALLPLSLILLAPSLGSAAPPAVDQGEPAPIEPAPIGPRAGAPEAAHGAVG